MAAALKSGWIKHTGLTKGVCISSRAALQAQSKEETSARSCLLSCLPSQRGWGPGPALIQARKCHRLSTVVKWKSFGKVEEAKTKGWKNKHLRSAGALWLMSVSRKGPNAWETNQQLWSANIWLTGTHCYSQIFLSHQAAQSSLSTAPAAAWAVNLERPQTTLGEING